MINNQGLGIEFKFFNNFNAIVKVEIPHSLKTYVIYVSKYLFDNENYKI